MKTCATNINFYNNIYIYFDKIYDNCLTYTTYIEQYIFMKKIALISCQQIPYSLILNIYRFFKTDAYPYNYQPNNVTVQNSILPNS